MLHNSVPGIGHDIVRASIVIETWQQIRWHYYSVESWIRTILERWVVTLSRATVWKDFL